MWGRPRKRVVTRRTSTGASIPAPVGGWDAQSPIASMPAENAWLLENWIPRPGYVEVRRGYEPWSIGPTSDVETLMVYREGGTSNQIFAASAGDLYDVSSQGATAESVSSGYTSNRWQWVNFANDAANTWLIACNGVDTPIRYDGSAWSDLAITGSAGIITLNPDTLVDVMAHKGRLFFAQDDSLRVWFLAPQAIQGAAELLDLGPVFTRGGELTCIDTWTLDGGAGPDDMAVFVTSQGQVAVYQGIDPSDANDWALVGVYDVGLPLSRRSLIKWGADLVLLTTDGVVPLSQALQMDRAQENLVALTQKIQNAFSQATRQYRNNFGWEGVLYPRGSLAIFNVPEQEFGTSCQFVQNVQTGAWCRFTNIPAFCWAVANDNPMFGAADGVYLWDSTALDNGEQLIADMGTAYNYFGSRGALKKFEMLQPIFRVASTVQPSLDVFVDFRDGVPQNQPSIISVEGAIWGESLWDEDVWGADFQIRDSWTSASGIGYCGSVRVRVTIDPDTAPSPELIAEAVAFNLKYQIQSGGQL